MYRNCTATVLEHQLSLYIITQLKVTAGGRFQPRLQHLQFCSFHILTKGGAGKWCGGCDGSGAECVEKGLFPWAVCLPQTDGVGERAVHPRQTL